MDEVSLSFDGIQEMSSNLSIVLAHGAWADGSSWAEVIAPLQRKGLKVVTVPLPLTSLSDDVAALDRTVERTQGPVILVAHAYAGAVISSSANERVKALVFIAALAPDEGETVADVFYRGEPHPKAPNLAPDDHGFIWMPDEAFASAFAHHAPSSRALLLAATQRPIALSAIQERACKPSWRTKPSFYLLAEEDRMINPITQRFMAERMGASISAEKVDHTPLVTAPDVVVRIILEAAAVA